MNRIKRISCFFRILFQCLFVITPITLALFWILWPTPLGFPQLNATLSFIPESVQIHLLPTMTTSTKILGFLISLIPVGIAEVALYFLIQLFRQYEKAEIFTFNSVSYIKKIGYTLLVSRILAAPVHELLLSAALTWHNPHGMRVMTLSITGKGVILVLVAFLVILISWIMAEACKLREDQQLTI